MERLGTADLPAIARLLDEDPVVNLFLLGFVRAHAMDRGWWYGCFEDGDLVGLTLVLPGRLAVPYAPEPYDAALLGDHLYQLHRPTLLVGPRGACDAMWERWTRGRPPTRAYDQRLYRLDIAPEGEDPPGFRPAAYEEWPLVAEYSAAMELEDLGRDPSSEDPRLHDQVVRERLKSGRTWVTAQGAELVFQCNVGSAHALGAQIGGTYVPPPHRGQGHARRGVAALCRRLLPKFPRVTLHVNEANAPAVRAYERVGFVRDAPFRLITP